MASASESMPVLPPNRRGLVAQWFVLVGAAIAIAVIVTLIVTWPDGNSSQRPTLSAPAAAKHAAARGHHTAAIKP
jgi:hypothetical protein